MLKNIVKVLLSNSILTIVGLINSFIFPALMSVEGYAYYQQYLLYISYVNICHLGMASGMFINYAWKDFRTIDKAHYKSEIYLIYGFLSFFSLIGLVCAGATKSTMLFCVALTIFPQCIIASFQALYQSWERFTGYAIVNALPKVLLTLVGFGAYFVFKEITGNFVVTVYLIIIWCVSLYFVTEFFAFTKGHKNEKLISKENINTLFNGFLITLGNYVNLLFHSIDKQFVNILYSTASFAQYSFAMSTQNIMTIFITALSNPFYPRLAKGDIDKKYIQTLKELLLMFGTYSGCAYFAVSFCVEHFIVKYMDSLKVVAIFFAVFPAMAVINVLYINMYKIQKKLKKYIFTLVGMFVVTVTLNGISVLLKGDYVGISFATMISYYIWLMYSQRDFDEITITRKDIIYLIGYFIVYGLSIMIRYNIIGLILYGTVISAWNYFSYNTTVKYMFIEILRRIKLKRS